MPAVSFGPPDRETEMPDKPEPTFHPEAIDDGAAQLVERYEYHRRHALRCHSHILTSLVPGGATWLDEADPSAFPEAADGILLAQAARAAIRAAARLERVWRSSPTRDERDPKPADELVERMTRERDLAAGFYYELRRRQAKLEHMDLANRRVRTALSLASGKAAPAPPTAAPGRPPAERPAAGRAAPADAVAAARTQSERFIAYVPPFAAGPNAGIPLRAGPARRTRRRSRRATQSGAPGRAMAAAMPPNRPRHRQAPTAGLVAAG